MEETKRQLRLETTCYKHDLLQTRDTAPDRIIPNLRSMIFPNLQLAVCQVAKAGSTYWREDIVPIFGGKMTMFYPKETQLFSWKHYKKALFVRHPLQRLFSSYNDKAVSLSVRLAGIIGRKVTQYVRNNKTYGYDDCYRDITFEDFAKMVSITINNSNADNHWGNMYKICHPCQIKFDLIGHLETFLSDLNLLKTIVPDNEFANNLTANLPRNAYIHDKCRQFSPKFLSPFVKRDGKPKCNKPSIILPAKLKSMENKGFTADLGFNQGSFTNLPPTKWETKCKALVNNILVDRNKVKLVKDRSRRTAIRYLRGLSKQTLLAVIEAYRIDFEMFGYDPYDMIQ